MFIRFLINLGVSGECSTEQWSLKEEVFWLVAQLPSLASNPAEMLTSLLTYLSKSNMHINIYY